MGLVVIPREEWGSWEPWSRTPRSPPVDTLLCSYTETETCRTISQCREFMQRIQRQHIRLDKLQDVPYNFVIGGDGNTYEGRGWLLSPELGESEQENKGKNIYIGICGHAGDADPRIWEALEELIKFGITYELIKKSFKTVHIPHFVPKVIATTETLNLNEIRSQVETKIKR